MTTSSPRKRNSSLIANLRTDRDPGNSDRIRTSMIIAARIATALHEKGWNKVKLAAELKKSPSLATRWLSGTHNFTVETLREIQQVLGIHLLNLEMQPDMARPCAIIPQGMTMNVREMAETYTAIPVGHERRFPSLNIQPCVQIFSARSLEPN
jgi:ribosome-binding protein aMBF1 (putative translation factor)